MGNDVKVFEHVLTANVATGGTFAVGYPSGTTRGSFLKGKNHAFVCQGATFEAPEDFTISFGSTTATITYNGSTTLLAGALVRVQLDIQGEETLEPFQHLVDGSVQKLHPLLLNLGSPILFDIDSLIDGATAAELPDGTPTTTTYTQADIGTSPCDGVNTTWVLETPRNLVMTVTHGSSIVATEARITGLDVFGNVMNETLAVTATGTSKTATGVKAFKEVTEIEIYGATTLADNTVEIGHGSVLGLPAYVAETRHVLAEIIDGTTLSRYGDYQRIPFQITEAEGDAASSRYVHPGFAGTVVDMGTVVDATVTTGGTLTAKIATVAVDGLGVVIADASSAGDVDTDSATVGHASTVFTAAQAIEIVGDAAINAGAPINGWIGVTRTNPLTGTLVPGLTPATKSTATTADVRGTYAPTATLDGSVSISLLVLAADPSFLGNPQYEG